MKRCETCGATVQDGEAFCGGCGAPAKIDQDPGPAPAPTGISPEGGTIAHKEDSKSSLGQHDWANGKGSRVSLAAVIVAMFVFGLSRYMQNSIPPPDPAIDSGGGSNQGTVVDTDPGGSAGSGTGPTIDVSGNPSAKSGAQIVKIDGKPHLPLRVVTRPFSHIYRSASVDGGIAEENVEPFSVFYVFDTPDGGIPRDGDREWYQVGSSAQGNALGWMRSADVIEWKQTLCVEYSHPDDAHPVLMFRDRQSLAAVAGSAPGERSRRVNELYAKIESGDMGRDFPVISISPSRAVDFQDKFYLMPILDYEVVQFEEWEGRLLKIAAATKAEAGRGATLIADEETRERLTTRVSSRDREMKDLRIDVVFVMDLTLSMQPFVDGALAFVKSAAETLGSASEIKDRVRFGFWGFRDSEEIPEIGFNTKNFTGNLQTLQEYSGTLARVKATDVDSIDFEEDVYAGVHDAITQTQWNDNAVRLIVLVGDAPAHELGHKWNTTQMGAGELRALAEENEVSVLAFHIKDPQFPKYHEAAAIQFARLAENPGISIGGGASYYSTNTRDMEQFRSDSDVVITAIADAIFGKIDLTAPTSSGGDDLKAVATEFVRAAVVRWLGEAQGIEAPKDVTAWVADKDLVNPSSQALKVNILLTKNQLDSLITGLKATLEAGTRGALSGASFFDELQATSAAATVKPDQIKNAKRLADTGLIPEFLKDLPYTSEVMDLSDEIWGSWGENRQDDFLRTVEAKIAYYVSLHDTPAAWIALAGGVDEDDKVAPIPLSRLP